jgi:integrase
LLSLVFRIGVQNGKAGANPARLVRPGREDNGRIRFLSSQEEAQLRSTIDSLCPERLPEFIVALNTGMRTGEQYALTWDRIDLQNAVVSINRSKNGLNLGIPAVTIGGGGRGTGAHARNTWIPRCASIRSTFRISGMPMRLRIKMPRGM